MGWSQQVKQCRRPWFHSWVWKIRWRRVRLPTPVFLGFPGGSAGKESVCNAGDLGSVPGLGRSPGEGKSYPFQYSGLENSLDCIVHGATKNRTGLKAQTRLSDFHFQQVRLEPQFPFGGSPSQSALPECPPTQQPP